MSHTTSFYYFKEWRTLIEIPLSFICVCVEDQVTSPYHHPQVYGEINTLGVVVRLSSVSHSLCNPALGKQLRRSFGLVKKSRHKFAAFPSTILLHDYSSAHTEKIAHWLRENFLHKAGNYRSVYGKITFNNRYICVVFKKCTFMFQIDL